MIGSVPVLHFSADAAGKSQYEFEKGIILNSGENGAEITAGKKADGYEVVLISTKKTPRGYAKIVLTYDLKSKLLTKMQMDEYNGNSTLYEMSGLKTNDDIDEKFFSIP